jgi:hypothetical protein
VVDALVAVGGEQHSTQWQLEVLVAGLADLLTVRDQRGGNGLRAVCTMTAPQT